MTRPAPWTSRRGTLRPFRWIGALAAGSAFGLVSILDLIAEASGRKEAAMAFRLLAMPLLASALIIARGLAGRTVRLVVAALVFSWLGDTVGGAEQLLKLCFFL